MRSLPAYDFKASRKSMPEVLAKPPGSSSARLSVQAAQTHHASRAPAGLRGIFERFTRVLRVVSFLEAKKRSTRVTCLHERSDMQPPISGHNQHSTPRPGAEYDAQVSPREENEAVQGVLSTEWPVVSVRWVDAEARGGPGWEDPEDMIEFALKPLVEVHTVGLLIYSCDQYIALTDSRAPDQIGGVQKIPRAWINAMDVMVASDDHLPPSLPMDGARAG